MLKGVGSTTNNRQMEMQHTYPRKLLAALLCTTLLLLTACTSDDEYISIVDAHLERNPGCLSRLGTFPLTVRKYNIPKYGYGHEFILDEFVALGYINQETLMVIGKPTPEKPRNKVEAIRYTLTEKGSVLTSSGRGLCYGTFYTESIGITVPLPTHNGKQYKMVRFEYAIDNVADWAIDNPTLSQLSDKMFADLHTLKEPRKGHVALKSNDGENWSVMNIHLGENLPSEVHKKQRAQYIKTRRGKVDYQRILEAEIEGVAKPILLAMYNDYTLRYRPALEEVKQRARELQTEQNNLEKERLKAERMVLSDLVNRFYSAVDAKDKDALSTLTTRNSAASKAYKNNLFNRYTVGQTNILSYKRYGQNNDHVQIQLDGGIYMIRASLIEGLWRVTGFSTKSTKWFDEHKKA